MQKHLQLRKARDALSIGVRISQSQAGPTEHSEVDHEMMPAFPRDETVKTARL